MTPTDSGRRRFLKVLGAGAAAGATSPMFEALGQMMPGMASTEFFIFVHAAGAWDITVGTDPRNQFVSITEPATTDTIDPSGLLHWTNGPAQPGGTSFRFVQPTGSNIRFGPAIGLMAEARRFERMLVINGIAMNTVSHPDGTTYSSTGRRLAGGKPVAPSIDTMLASELGTSQLFPTLSVRYPSYYTGPNLSSRALPLRVDAIGSVARSLARSNRAVDRQTRTAVNELLREETRDLIDRSYFPQVYQGIEQQLESLERIHGNAELTNLFSTTALAAKPELAPIYRPMRPGTTTPMPYVFENNVIHNAAFAVEAFRLNLARCVSFSTTSFDTHFSNYEDHPQHMQELFNMLAGLIDVLGATNHPTVAGHKLLEHTHILVTSDFCRTPQINVSGGRDHYPSNSAVIISPRFRGNTVFGATDPNQLLSVRRMIGGELRAITPADVLATFLDAFGVDPRRFMRDGAVMREIRR
jgi:hypothetical protein